MSRAAQTLSVTQGAVTQQMRHLERILGLQLIERVGRGVRLTPAAVEVAGACATAARELEAIEETAQLHRKLKTGRLMVGASPTCANHYLPPLLAAFVKRWPEVDIKVTAGNTPTIAELVSKAELDCGLVEGAHAYANLETRRLNEDTMVLVVSARHPLARAPHSKEGLARHRYLAREPGSATESVAEAMLGKAYGASPRLELSHLDAVRAAAIDGLGYAALPEVTIARELESGQLVRMSLPTKKRWITALRRESSRAPVVEAFWAVLPDRGL
jgi:DNA-binding transcriptional LysR family regulator